ncbi:hypothetical protein [Acinetobacter larvae]|uniref:Uncharacterized protein n=1 Tax=Acinetobacter larvae TaxID=1789224 RepID=A0A1B2LZ93_9GAMM|nr:hypothetical protein [Acinetobacter larvae]AOA58241.1 hypothetical protein BFG52_07660 [Acinetobacter larvae]
MADKIVTVQKLQDADKDCDSLDDVISGGEYDTVKTRRGKEYPTMPNAIRQLMENGGFKPFATESELLAYVPAINPSAAKALDTKKIWLWDGTRWNDTGLSELDQANDFTRSLGALRLNQGNKTPFKFLPRNNINTEVDLDNTSSAWVMSKVLKVEVQNARANKYYRIATAYTATDTTYPCRWIIEECDVLDFDKKDTSTRIITNTHAQPIWKNNTDIQTIVLTPTAAAYNDIRIIVTIDTNIATGTFRAINPTQTAYALIIDPAFYIYKTSTSEAEVNTIVTNENIKLNSLELNRGKNIPLLQKKRNNISSEPSAGLNNILLGVKVINAQEGFFYRIAYFVNGSTALSGSHPEGWRIEKIAKDNYENQDNAVSLIITNTDVPTQILDRVAKGIQKITLKSPRSSEIIDLTIDVDRLPNYGSFMRYNLPTDPSYSFVIHPIYYDFAEDEIVIPSISGIGYSYNTTRKRLTLTWQNGKTLYSQVFGINGFNDLPNFTSLSKKGINDTEWVLIQSYASDVLPPLIIDAVDNPTAPDLPSIYTGGNHGTSGSAGGFKTAINDNYQIILGGNAIDMSKNQSGITDSVKINISNRLHACNTIQVDNTPGRYVIQQNFMIDFKDGSWCVTCFNKKLEDVNVRGDNGLQTFSQGLQESWLFLDGQYAHRVPFDPTQDSGIYKDYPNCWAMVLQGNNTQWVSWYDKTVGLGDGSQISNNAKRFRGGGSSNTKIYAAAISAKPLLMTTVDSYSWRMGFSIQSTEIPKPLNTDSSFIWNRLGKTANVLVYDASTYFME